MDLPSAGSGGGSTGAADGVPILPGSRWEPGSGTEQARSMTNDAELPDREPGYYWVNWSGEPEPAMWDGTRWCFIGTGDHAPDRPIVLSEEPIEFESRSEKVAG
jgi:hypothetical protein